MSEAAAVIALRLAPRTRDWIVQHPLRDSQAVFYFGPPLLADPHDWREVCGTTDDKSCSDRLIAEIREVLRRRMDRQLVARLDCQLDAIGRIPVDVDAFEGMHTVDLIAYLQEILWRAHSSCGQPVRLRVTGDPDANCWMAPPWLDARPMSPDLGQLLFALSLLNGFTVRHDPPVVELHFDSRCAWPRRPPEGIFQASP
jgi:hypothetical protein